MGVLAVLVGELVGASTCCTCRAAASLRRSRANVANRKASHAATRMSVAIHGSREKANCLGLGLGFGLGLGLGLGFGVGSGLGSGSGWGWGWGQV